MPRVSAGLLLYRRTNKGPQVLLAHPGGPFFAHKDLGAWTIPKGEQSEGEELIDTARREFTEETGHVPPDKLVPLAPIKQKAGKIVHAWAVEGDFDCATLTCNTFTTEWPPKSGKFAKYPEIDRAEFFDLPAAREKINPAQIPFLDELERLLAAKGDR